MDKKDEKFAVAFKYTDKNIPKIVAAGKGKLAEKILEIAEKNQIEVRKEEESEDIVKLRYKGNIPYQVYGVITEVLSFVYKLNEKWKNEKK